MVGCSRLLTNDLSLSIHHFCQILAIVSPTPPWRVRSCTSFVLRTFIQYVSASLISLVVNVPFVFSRFIVLDMNLKIQALMRKTFQFPHFTRRSFRLFSFITVVCKCCVSLCSSFTSLIFLRVMSDGHLLLSANHGGPVHHAESLSC